MTRLLTLFLLSCFGFHFFSGAADAQLSSNAFFSRHLDTKFQCSIYKTLLAVNRLDCHEKCFEELSCFSNNFYQSENGTNVCELIRGTKSSLGKPDCLVSKQGSEYNELMNADFCSSSVSCEAGKIRKAFPDNWYQLDSSAFKHFEQLKDYTEASAVCSANGGTLATINSEDENRFVAEMFLDESKRDVFIRETLKPFKRWKLDGSDQDVTLHGNLVAKKDEYDISAALHFQGTAGSYATIPAWSINKMTFSISLWLKLQNLPSSKDYFYSYWYNPFLFFMGVRSSGIIQTVCRGASTGKDILNFKAGKVVLNKWTHIVFVWNRETKQAKFYQDGSQVYASTPLTTSNIDFAAPKRSVFDVGYKRDNQRVMKGWLRELLVFNRAVTSKEVNIIQDATLLDPRTWIGPPQSYLNMAPVSQPNTNCFTVRAWGTYQWEKVPCDRTMKFICKKLV